MPEMKIKTVFGYFCYLIVAAMAATDFQASQTNLSPECIHPPYNIHFLSRDPLVLPIPGNAVFRANLVSGKGDQRTIHSGAVVTSGEKVGLNLWTREGPLSPRLRGEVDHEVDEES
jgi:hypothetical protein